MQNAGHPVIAKTEGTIDAKDPSVYGREKDSHIGNNSKGAEGAWTRGGGGTCSTLKGLDGHHEEKESWINGQIVIIIAVLGGG